MTCFRPGYEGLGGGSDLSDIEVYKLGSLKGGLAYSDKELKNLFAESFEIVEIRAMKEMESITDFFGKEFLWACLFRKKI